LLILVVDCARWVIGPARLTPAAFPITPAEWRIGAFVHLYFRQMSESEATDAGRLLVPDARLAESNPK
jgi:hypothetical protein